MIANKKYTNNSRIIQCRNANNVLFSDHDMYINIWINQSDRENTGDVVVTFDKQMPLIVANWHYGNNAKKLTEYKNTKSFSKVTKINSDDNGPGNGSAIENIPAYIYIDNTSLIESLTLSAGAGIQNIEINHLGVFWNLKKISTSISVRPDFKFLENNLNVKQLLINISTANFTNINFLKHSTIEVLVLRGYNLVNTSLFIDSIPNTTKYLSVTQLQSVDLDLASVFTGTLQGLSLSNVAPVRSIDYNGGAVFPAVINEIEDYAQDYILYKASSNGNSNLGFTPDKVSRFLVDFANQVIACNLPSSAKRIRLLNCTPNISYEDLSQPLFKTYASALAHITGTLGVTVQFT